ncbi:hypothetical protein AMD01_23110 [Priestia koreensis]|uniref:Uncharacterized protein n=1 Tax=Priestia koreensis TaxID=284581 RepID=A0A0M0KG15_9BACI|nr:hypothetical protein AMD01_23110 [Priestia koreensis]
MWVGFIALRGGLEPFFKGRVRRSFFKREGLLWVSAIALRGGLEPFFEGDFRGTFLREKGFVSSRHCPALRAGRSFFGGVIK